MSKKRVWVKIKNFLKNMNCCQSSCLNNTIENVNMNTIEELMSKVIQLQEQITELASEKKPEITSL